MFSPTVQGTHETKWRTDNIYNLTYNVRCVRGPLFLFFASVIVVTVYNQHKKHSRRWEIAVWSSTSIDDVAYFFEKADTPPSWPMACPLWLMMPQNNLAFSSRDLVGIDKNVPKAVTMPSSLCNKSCRTRSRGLIISHLQDLKQLIITRKPRLHWEKYYISLLLVWKLL